MRVFVLVILCLIWGSAASSLYEDAVVRITIPQGFEGPILESPVQNSKVIGFRKKYPADQRSTVIGIATYDFGNALSGMPPERRDEVTDKYLSDYLQRLGRIREGYKVSQHSKVVLGGIPAARAEWTGALQGGKMSGVLYCAVVGTSVVYLYTQDFADAPPQHRTAAIQAIEAVTFRVQR